MLCLSSTYSQTDRHFIEVPFPKQGGETVAGRREREPEVKIPARLVRIQSFKLQVRVEFLQEMLKSLASCERGLCFL